MIRDCIISLLTAYADYETPVVRHVGKSDGVVFRSIVNHRFVKEMMRSVESRVRAVYGAFETTFHADGLYWLQYGLALRDFGRHSEALEKFSTARQAFGSPQIEHAYAQQLMIIAKNAATWDEAEPQLVEAIDIFRSLDSVGWEGDTYPIVSLAEGHIALVSRFKGLETAQSMARHHRHMERKLSGGLFGARVVSCDVMLSTGSYICCFPAARILVSGRRGTTRRSKNLTR